MNARRYPRTMDEAYGPYNRSSQCEIVPMDGNAPHPADVLVVKVSLWCLVALAVIFTAEWFYPEWFA
ncbi:MAG: hypothetical protein EOP24_26150 [Hyphomicrobiales bacterium]|nr:MAG: hypothetical protein EOP24_26150 [Hyphomicrobiales bacterium]